MPGVDELRARIQPLLARLDGLSLRERALVMLTALMVFGALWYGLLMQPLAQRAIQSHAEIAAMQDRIAAANSSLEEQILQLGGGADQRSRIASLQKRIDEINTTLGSHAAELIDPAEMAKVLEGVLQEQSQLNLVRMGNMQPEFLTAGDADDAATFYRHGLEIEVEGSFAACLEYLDAIEALPWRLYWQLLDLEVIDYPHNRIRIEVSTLSLDEEWIGA